MGYKLLALVKQEHQNLTTGTKRKYWQGLIRNAWYKDSDINGTKEMKYPTDGFNRFASGSELSCYAGLPSVIRKVEAI